MKSLERAFERVLWQSRLLVVVAVVGSAFLAFGAFYMATVDVVILLGNLLPYASPLDLLYLALGLLFIGGALYLSGPGGLRGRTDSSRRGSA